MNFLSLAIALQLANAPGTVLPPPPYDPQPGPHIIFLDSSGRFLSDQDETIANTVDAWRSAKLEMFLLCFRASTVAQTRAVDPYIALKTVAQKLKTVGARTVVVPYQLMCSGSPRLQQKDHSSVEITGVVSL